MKLSGQVLTALVLLLLPVGGLHAQSVSPSGILFLNVRISDSTAILLESSVRPGVFKQRRSGEHEGEIHLEMVGGNGLILWSGSIDDPLQQVIEFVNEDGSLQSIFKSLPKAETWVRMPYFASAVSVNVYRNEKRAKSRSQTSESRMLIGVLHLQN